MAAPAAYAAGRPSVFYGHHHHHHRAQLPLPVTLLMFLLALALRMGTGTVISGHPVGHGVGVGIGMGGFRPSEHAPNPTGVAPDPDAPIRHEVTPPPPAPPSPVLWALGLGATIGALGLLGAAFLWTSGADDEPRAVRRRPA